MSSKLRVTLCQLAVGSDKAANLSKASSMIAEAARRGSALAVLPECFNCPYGTKYFGEYAEALEAGNPTYDTISRVARENDVWVIAGSIPERGRDGKLYNASMTFARDGTLRSVHRKVHLFRINTETVKMDEGDVLTAGDTAIATDMDGSLKFGVGICFDVRYPQLAWKYVTQDTSFLVYPGAFNMVTGPAHWQLSARSRAVDSQQFVLMCSPARDTALEYVAWGHSLVVDPIGNVIAEADEKEGFVDAELDLELIHQTRERIPIFKGTRNDLYSLQWN